MGYEAVTLTKELTIDKIFSIHYFEYMNDFSFPGETHNFWELVCVDKGAINITSGNKDFELQKGQIAFHKPNEFHNVNANGTNAPNLVVISFECTSPAMKYFENRVLEMNETERALIARIISERKYCISSPINNPYLQKMERLPQPYFGSLQMIQLHLEELMLLMLRRQAFTQKGMPPVKSIKHNTDKLLYDRITTYLEEHVRERLTLDMICSDNLISRSQIEKIFRFHNKTGVIDYFSKLKIECAKLLIRENHHNFTQISEFLGYSGIHYFSRQFKKITGMSPSEYASSIKVISER